MNKLLSQSDNNFELLGINYVQIGLTAIIIIIFFIVRSILLKFVKTHSNKYGLGITRSTYIRKLLSFGLIVIAIALIGIVWDISFKGLAIYFASLFTIIGIGFFASWSILSNITAATILFFYYPFKVGTKVKIVDGENSVVGKVEDVTLFSIKLKLDNGEKLSYPNNLAIQKPIIELED